MWQSDIKKTPMKVFKKLMLLLALLLVFGLLRAQVECQHHNIRDTLSKNMFANLNILNQAGVEIHNALDAQVRTPDGRLVYRYYVPKMINETGRGLWSLGPNGAGWFWETNTYTGGRLLVDKLDLPNYTGDLILSLTLRHPLDTNSVVCQTELKLPLSNGIIDYNRMTDEKVRENFGYYRGLSFELEEIKDRFTLANLRDFTLVNSSSHTICEDIDIRIRQSSSGWDFYELKLKDICVPPGRHTLTPEQFASATIDDRYEKRDTLRPFQVLDQLAGSESGDVANVPAIKHGARVLPTKERYFNAALNISVDFLAILDPYLSPLPPSSFTLLEDMDGHPLSLQRPDSDDFTGPDLSPASPYGDLFLKMEARVLMSYNVFRADDLTNEQVANLFFDSEFGRLAPFTVQQHGPLEVILPSLNFAAGGSEKEAQQGFTFIIRHYDLLYCFGIYPFSYFGDESYFKPEATINSIEINGHRLHFSFADEADWVPTDFTLLPGKKTTTLSKADYYTRLNTFLLYEKDSQGKPELEVTLKGEAGAARLKHLLTLPYTTDQLDSIQFPSLKRQTVGKNGRFSFQEYREEEFGVTYGLPQSMPITEFSDINKFIVDETLGIDKDGNLIKTGSSGVSSQITGEVDQEVTISGKKKIFYGMFNKEKGLDDFCFAVSRYEAEGIPKQFFRAITLLDNIQDNSVLKTMLHDNKKYDVYRSPLKTGFLHNDPNPGMSLLVTGGDYLYQFTVSGINEGEIRAWLTPIKIEGKSLKLAPMGSDNYDISLE
jgi:hypothetical protein